MGDNDLIRSDTQNGGFVGTNELNIFPTEEGPEEQDKMATLFGLIKENHVRRVFDKPIIASPLAAMSQECVSCSQRGIGCILVGYVILYYHMSVMKPRTKI